MFALMAFVWHVAWGFFTAYVFDVIIPLGVSEKDRAERKRYAPLRWALEKGHANRLAVFVLGMAAMVPVLIFVGFAHPFPSLIGAAAYAASVGKSRFASI